LKKNPKEPFSFGKLKNMVNELKTVEPYFSHFLEEETLSCPLMALMFPYYLLFINSSF
jgi:hypothetical protein